ncbi:MAG: hypothetical protein OEV73_07255, partial [Desulfobulbaceae bacterium]|nr:hypothetical protein [Desulfobulbaceae bacterium]
MIDKQGKQNAFYSPATLPKRHWEKTNQPDKGYNHIIFTGITLSLIRKFLQHKRRHSATKWTCAQVVAMANDAAVKDRRSKNIPPVPQAHRQ